jgi:hypothetical protein
LFPPTLTNFMSTLEPARAEPLNIASMARVRRTNPAKRSDRILIIFLPPNRLQLPSGLTISFDSEIRRSTRLVTRTPLVTARYSSSMAFVGARWSLDVHDPAQHPCKCSALAMSAGQRIMV